MTKVIIYKQESGVVAVIHPTEEAARLFGINAIAKKDVPAGKPYKIIDVADLPTDRSQRDAWTVDEADLTDGVGATWSAFGEGEAQ